MRHLLSVALAGLQVPFGHAWHLTAPLPAGAKLTAPAGQAVQDAAPGAGEKLPGGHTLHVCEPGPSAYSPGLLQGGRASRGSTSCMTGSSRDEEHIATACKWVAFWAFSQCVTEPLPQPTGGWCQLQRTMPGTKGCLHPGPCPPHRWQCPVHTQCIAPLQGVTSCRADCRFAKG